MQNTNKRPRVLRDQNKAMLAKFEYMPYGEPLSSAGVSSCMGYTGMWQSCNSGNLHFPLREYDPDIARWTTRDPLGMAAGPNMHIYVLGNPASMVDPTGGMPWIIPLAGGLAAGGFLGGFF
ncbi:MAG TPA: RHS repeat-associated core domain-containing protein [Candidatus Hydrogenedentes bacterium]|nr:RHS repeat-associated core domain-containing protein [Candidatus Hydrogenedentota bacterium]